jgi:PAS domain S-box-containing protein
MNYLSKTKTELIAELIKIKEENQRFKDEKDSDLREEIIKLKQVIQNSGEIIFMTDVSGIITFVNREFTNVYGYSPDEIIGLTTPRILKSGLNDPARYQLLWSTILNKQVSKNEFTNKTKDGSLIIVEGSVNAILDHGKNIIGFLAIQRDVTGLKKADELNNYQLQLENNIEKRTKELIKTVKRLEKEVEERITAEENLKISEEKYRSLVEASSSGIMVTKFNLIKFCNPKSAEIFGVKSPSDLINKSLTDFLSPGDLDLLHNSRNNLYNAKLESVNTLYRIKKPDGGTAIIESIAINYPFEGDNCILSFISDVTMRINTQKSLKESEERFRIAAQTISDVVWEIDIDTGIFDWYGDIDRFLGYEPDQFPRTFAAWKNSIFADDLNRVINALNNHLQNGSPFREEYRIRKKDGSLAYCIDQGVAIRDANGKACKMIGAYKDVTEQKLMEEALSLSEKKFATIFKESPASFSLSRLSDGTFIDVNDAFLQTFKISKKDVLGKTSWELNFFYDYNDRIKLTEQIKIKGSVRNLEFLLRRSTGEIFPCLWSSVIINNGYEETLVTTLLDITERKTTEQELEKSRKEFQTLADNLPDIVLRFDRNLDLIYTNKPFDPITYLNKKSALEDKESITPDQIVNISKWRKMIADTIFSGQIQKSDFDLADMGERHYYETFMVPEFSQNREVATILTVARNLTERKIIEEKIAATLTEREVLLREIHHRVKNNLQTIIYLIDMQLESLREDPATVILFRELQTKVRTMSLIHEQLYKSKNLSQIDIDDYLRSLVSNLLSMYDNSVRIKLKLDHSITFLNFETAIPCGMIINELITNSMKYAFPENFRPVDQWSPEIAVEFYKSGDDFILVVADNGIGIKNDINLQETESLGLKLVNIWATYQLGGSLSLDHSKGMRYLIKFNKEK